MSRNALTVWEKNRKKEFDKLVKEYSVQGLQNIWKIANTASDTKTRLQANIFIVEKAVGKNYKSFTDEQNKGFDNVTINLFSDNFKTNRTEQETETWNMENNNEDETSKETVDVREEDWGNEIYEP